MIHGSNFQNHCSTPTNEFVVGVVIGTLKYNISTINVDKGECFTIVFQNLDPSIEHDLVIDKVGGSSNISVLDADLTKAEINEVAFDSAGPTVDYGWGPNGIDKFNVLAPSVDTTFIFFCDIPGHRSAGMEGTLVVTNTSSFSSSRTSSSLSLPSLPASASSNSPSSSSSLILPNLQMPMDLLGYGLLLIAGGITIFIIVEYRKFRFDFRNSKRPVSFTKYLQLKFRKNINKHEKPNITQTDTILHELEEIINENK